MIQIRTIQSADYLAVAQLNRDSFTFSTHGYSGEAELVERLRKEKNYRTELELVACENDTIIGHGLLSEVSLLASNNNLVGLCLAPIAVASDWQKQGVGSQIIQELEKRAQQFNYPYISILGNPNYYGKFGYLPAEQFNIQAAFTVPAEYYLIKELQAEHLLYPGIIHYSKAFE